jgi:hypothetical protein
MTPVIYLASPIDQGTVLQMRNQAKAKLLEAGCAVFDPGTGWAVGPDTEPTHRLQTANLAVLARCDGILAIYDPHILTIGVTIELMEACPKPSHVWAPNLKPSWALTYLDVKVHVLLDNAIEELVADVVRT